MTTATQVIFRQFGGDSSSRTVKSGHTAIRADQFDPNGWQPSRNLGIVSDR